MTIPFNNIFLVLKKFLQYIKGTSCTFYFNICYYGVVFKIASTLSIFDYESILAFRLKAHLNNFN